MGLRINTNVLSLAAQRSINQTSKSLSRALERLSSGSRINRAGDDAAGMAISAGLDSQVRGLRVTIRNANDGIGFLNTAEGGLQELTNITQRLRELAIQASNGTLSSTDRGYLDSEADALVDEFDRIAQSTEFNGVKLLDGSFATTELQVGLKQGDTISFSIGNARANSLGAVATKSGGQHFITADVSNLSINGQTAVTFLASDDTVSSAGNSYSAIAIAQGINNASGTTDVRAVVLDNKMRVYDLSFGSFSGTIDAGELKINGVNITGSATSVNGFISLINTNSNSTGVKARLVSGSVDDIELYASDGRNIEFFVSGDFASTGMAQVLGAGTNFAASFTLLFSAASGSLALTTTGYERIITGAIKLTSADAITLSASASTALGFSGVSISVDTNQAISNVDISSQTGAQNALDIIDSTLGQLNSLRATLGATQNRLEYTTSNLSITLENIASAKSQLSDTDIAAETAELTRAQILQQAGIAVLGQANQAPQVALALLRF